MPDLLADAFAEPPAPPAVYCTVGKLIDEATVKGRANFQAWLDAKHVPAFEIVEQLRKAGIAVSKDTVQDHRGKRCRCAKQPL